MCLGGVRREPVCHAADGLVRDEVQVEAHFHEAQEVIVGGSHNYLY
jgi:hypothetical protein